MTKAAVKKGLEILTGCQNIDALRRLIVMTIVGRNLMPASANGETTNDDSLSALLSRLPTKALAEVASISKGKTGIKDALPGPYPLVVTAETRSSADHFDFEGPAVMIPMVSSTGHGDASLKRIHFQDGQYAVGSILAVVHPKDSSVLSARYLHAYLSAFKDELLVSRMVGTANVSLTVAKIGDVPVPLLPIQGQHEIAELMALCDRLEAEQADAAGAHARLVKTLLGALTQSTDAADFATNWQRLAKHFDTLFTTEASIDALKQTVLQLAVMGKLVPQDPNDESASELLKRIGAKRALMESDGVCKKSKPLPPVNDHERHHAIPAPWEYVRLQEVCLTITDGTHQTPKYTESGRPFLSAQNVKPFRFMPESFRYVSEEDYQGYVKTTKPEFGDVLLTRVGAMIGEAAVIDKRMDFAIYVSLALLKPCRPFVSPEFITLWLNSPFGTHSAIRDTLGRGVSAGNLNLGMIRAFALPLPPVDEQQRIVSKAHELMALCDNLKADLATARQRQATLADALIGTALEAA